jgi:outer membrane protein assembly factor BamB
MVRWQYSLAGVSRVESGLTLGGGALYFEGDEHLIAVGAASGTLRWQSPALVDRSNSTLVWFVVPQG